jgi:hypothetical protein
VPATWLDNNYRLGVGSIGIDAGRNASVPSDAADLDGNGITRKPITVDLDDIPRFADDRAVRDTGDGLAPIVDLGAYERDPVAYRAQFRALTRQWLGGDGAFEDASGWLNGAPQPTEQATFATDGSSTITTSSPVTVDALDVTAGAVDLSIDSSLTCTDVLRIGGTSPRLTVSGGILTATDVIVDGVNAELRTASPIIGNVHNFGSFGSIAGGTKIVINGDYRQVEQTNGQRRAGDLVIRVGDDTSCMAQERVAVTGTAALGGGLVLDVNDRCNGGDELTQVTLLVAGGVDPEANRFDGIANLPTFADGSFGRIVYEETPAVAPGSAAFRVVLEITTQTELLSRLNPLQPTIERGDPTAVTTADFDGDGDDDVAITTLGPRGTPGAVLILRSDGTGGVDAVQQVPVGVEPLGITAGPLDGNASIDIAVTSAADETVTILANDGTGGFAVSDVFFVGRPDEGEPIDNRPIGITAFQLYPASTLGVTSLDLAVANSGSNSMSVIANNGIVGFEQIQLRETGAGPRSIAWVDIDEDKDLDLVVTNFASDSVTIFNNNGNGGFQTLAAVSVGDGPSEVVVGDVNADDRGDLLIGNAGNGTISVLIGEGDGTFRPPFPVTMSTDVETPNVISITALDLDGDNDDDLVAVVAADGTTDVWQSRNAFDGETAQVSFLTPETLDRAEGTVLVASGDVNGDSQNDVVAIGATGGGGGGGGEPFLVLRPFENCVKLGDLDTDCVVGGDDLLRLVEAWGPCSAGAPCPADLDGNGGVGFSDLMLFLAAWES